MFNIHPQVYTFLYFHFLLIVVLISIYRFNSKGLSPSYDRTGVFVFAGIILLFIGLRPYDIPGVGTYLGDTGNYYRSFLNYAVGNTDIVSEDTGFDFLTKKATLFLSGQSYFFVLAALYVLPLYKACTRLSSDYTYLLFLMITTSFLFWANGVNGIRTGIGTSLLLLAFTYKNEKWLMIALFVLAISFHKSMLLPMGAFVLTSFYKNSRVWIAIWFICIVLSLLLGGFWEQFFASFNTGDERFSQYLTQEVNAEIFSSTGFRWDFLIYSAIPIALGYHFIFQKKYNSAQYIHLYNTYILANSFWILIIRSNFSNRFASLSWFLIPFILILPLLKIRLWKYQLYNLSLILILSFLFTYYMSINLIWK